MKLLQGLSVCVCVSNQASIIFTVNFYMIHLECFYFISLQLYVLFANFITMTLSNVMHLLVETSLSRFLGM